MGCSDADIKFFEKQIKVDKRWMETTLKEIEESLNLPKDEKHIAEKLEDLSRAHMQLSRLLVIYETLLKVKQEKQEEKK